MKWFRWLRYKARHADLDERIRDAREERAEVLAMRSETERLARRINRRLEENHFAERITEALIAKKRQV